MFITPLVKFLPIRGHANVGRQQSMAYNQIVPRSSDWGQQKQRAPWVCTATDMEYIAAER